MDNIDFRAISGRWMKNLFINLHHRVKKAARTCNFRAVINVKQTERMKKISFRNDILPLKNGLYRLALRITLNSAEAEDIVQETMIKVWNRRDTWDEIESIEAFCYTVCRNLSIDKTRSPAADSQPIDAALGEAEADRSYTADPATLTEQRDRLGMIRKIMSGLPEKQRSAMHLRDFEGKSYKEIAAILGISEEQVKVNIFRARQTIKKIFSKTEQYGL